MYSTNNLIHSRQIMNNVLFIDSCIGLPNKLQIIKKKLPNFKFNDNITIENDQIIKENVESIGKKIINNNRYKFKRIKK
jgi:hypothetical protein